VKPNHEGERHGIVRDRPRPSKQETGGRVLGFERNQRLRCWIGTGSQSHYEAEVI